MQQVSSAVDLRENLLLFDAASDILSVEAVARAFRTFCSGCFAHWALAKLLLHSLRRQACKPEMPQWVLFLYYLCCMI